MVDLKGGIRFLKYVAAAVAMMALPVGTHAQVNAEQVMNIGRNVLSMDDYMLAIQYFNQAIKAKPYLSEPYYLRALAKLNLEDYKGAEEDCSLAIERNNFRSEAYKLRGFARQYLGKDSLAIQDYDAGLKYYPMDKYFLFYKGVAQTSMESYEAADTTFTKLLRYFPNFEDGLTARGRLRVLRGDTVGALEDIARSISISPNEVNPYLVRAEIEAKRSEWEAACADMDVAVKLNPQETDYYINRAYMRYNADDFFGAMSDYNYALELDPSNSSALFNRALLRYEVRDLNRAEADFSGVLKLDPSNFHALFNRGLVNLDRGDNKSAVKDFRQILKRYPRFYPAYYALAEAYRNMGDMRAAMQNVYAAEDLIRKYVKNPKGNPLDRPKIAMGTANDGRLHADGMDEESEIEVMDKFNQLVTVSKEVDSDLSFNEKIKGRVQNRDIDVAPEPFYALSFIAPGNSLRSVSNYFRELDDFNQRRYIGRTIYLTPGNVTASGEEELAGFFEETAHLEALAKRNPTPANYLALGVAHTMLRNYQEAVRDFDAAIKSDSSFAIAYMGRAFARYNEAVSPDTDSEGAGSDGESLRRGVAAHEMAAVVADYNEALHLNPRLVFAWFNIGNVYYSLEDYTSAIQSYGEAIAIDPEFGQAYYNRGLSYLRVGNRQQAFADLSRAGELGVLPSYNLLKRMK